MLKQDVCSALSTILRHGVDVHRCAAARALGRLAEPTTVPSLIEALLDEDVDVRTDSAAALSELRDVRSASVLMESLVGDPCSEVKLSAIATLVQLRYPPLVPLLKRLVTESDQEIAWDVEVYDDGMWDDWLDVQIAAIRGLAEVGVEDAVPQIVAAFEDELGQDLAAPVIAALPKLGSPGTEALEDLYAKGDAQLRRQVAEAIAEGTFTPTLDALRKRCLADSSPQVRAVALKSLIRSRPDDERIKDYFHDGDSGIRGMVVTHAGARQPETTIALLNDHDPDVRCAAFAVIADNPALFDKDHLSEILRSAVSGNAKVAAEAVVAWAAVDPVDALPILEHALKAPEQPLIFRRGIIRALARIGPSAVQILATAAGDAERQIRLDALTALAREASRQDNWPTEAGDCLLAALAGELVTAPEESAEKADEETPNIGDETEGDKHKSGPSEQASVDMANSGGNASDNASASTLQTILSGSDDAPAVGETPQEIELTEEDIKFIALAKRRGIAKKKISLETRIAPHQDVRRFAARLLGDIHCEAVIPSLIDAATDDDAEVRQAVLESLVEVARGIGRLPRQTLETLQVALTTDHVPSRMYATRALGMLDAPEATDLLQGLVKDENPHVRLEAIRSLDARGEIDIGMSACLRDENTGVRKFAADAIASHCGRDAVEPLVAFAFFDDGTHRSQASQLLANLAPEQATLRFLEILADKSRRRHWVVAIEALGELVAALAPTQGRAAA